MNIEQTSTDLLIQHGIKPSMQRIAILDWLRLNPVHPTVDVIYAALSPQMPTLSKTTVYNTLKLFSQEGVALCLNLDERNQHFDATVMPHAHFICSQCGNVHDVFLTDHYFCLPSRENTPEIDIQRVEISYYGLCKQCSKPTE